MFYHIKKFITKHRAKKPLFLSLTSKNTGVFLQKKGIMAKIHESQLFEYVQTVKRFSITWVAEDGSKVAVPTAECTSFHSSGKTMNIKCLQSGQIRKVNRLTIVEINGMEVFK